MAAAAEAGAAAGQAGDRGGAEQQRRLTGLALFLAVVGVVAGLSFGSLAARAEREAWLAARGEALLRSARWLALSSGDREPAGELWLLARVHAETQLWWLGREESSLLAGPVAVAERVPAAGRLSRLLRGVEPRSGVGRLAVSDDVELLVASARLRDDESLALVVPVAALLAERPPAAWPWALAALAGVLMPLALWLLLRAHQTQRAELERALGEARLVWTQAGVALLLCDRQGRILELNPSAQEILGRARHDLVGHTLQQLAAPGGDPGLAGVESLEPGEQLEGQAWFERADARPQPVELSATRLADQRLLLLLRPHIE